MNAETASRVGFWGSEGSSWGCWTRGCWGFWEELGEVGELRVILAFDLVCFCFVSFFGKFGGLGCLDNGNKDTNWI